MNLSRSLCFGAVLALTMPSLATAGPFCDGDMKCVKRSLVIADQCRIKIDLPKRMDEKTEPSLEQHTKIAECEEVAAKTASKAVADELRLYARDERKQAKPGVVIGMTMQQVTEETSWGAPRDKHRTTTATATSEQWVYGDRSYLYFDNGVLVSIRN